MRNFAFTSALVCFLVYSPSAFAFVVNSNNNVAQTFNVRPPERAILRPPSLVNNFSTEDTTILGNIVLPKTNRNYALKSTDALAQQVESYLKSIAGSNIDIRVMSTQSDGQTTIMTFVQVVNEVTVEGTYALAQLQGNTVHYARFLLVNPPSVVTTAKVDAAGAEQAALADAATFAKQSALQDEDTTLTIVYNQQTPVLAYRVAITTQEPWGSFNIFIDAQAGTMLLREQTSLDSVSGTVKGQVEACAGEATSYQPLPYVQWNSGANAKADGSFASTVNYNQASINLYSPYVKVNNYNHADATWLVNLQGGTADNDLELEGDMAQIDAFYHLNVVRSWMRDGLDKIQSPAVQRAINWSNKQLWANVNLPTGYENMYCNAFYDPSDVTINFFAAYNGSSYRCNNTARVSKVVYHEYGHGIHHHLAASYPRFDGQLSEGVGDIVSASITGSPDITGLMGCRSILGGTLPRTCENTFTYCSGNSCDSAPNDLDPHQAAPVLCGAFWDLGKLMNKRYGSVQGKAVTQQLFLKFLTLAGNMNSSYKALISVDDDGDRNANNGTIHSCEINQAFAAHFPEIRRTLVPCKQ